MSENVSHPKHYNNHASGIECIQVVEHMGFNLGNAIKYIWRCDDKHDAIEDLKKAEFYIRREIERREKEKFFKPQDAIMKEVSDRVLKRAKEDWV